MKFRQIVVNGALAAALLSSTTLVAGCANFDNPLVAGRYNEQTGEQLRVSDVEVQKEDNGTARRSSGNSFLAGCSRNAIVGKFQETDGAEVLEFFNDGTCTVTNSGLSFDGTYSYDNSIDCYAIRFAGFGSTVAYEGYLDKDTLTLVNGSKEEVYERL